MKKLILSFCLIIAACFLVNAKANKDFVIVIHAGHGAGDAGAKAADGTLEKDLTLLYAQALQKMASESDFKIVMCRTDDSPFDLNQRAALIATHQADLFLSLHFNENADASKRGFECYVGTQTHQMENRVLGKFMGAELYRVNGMKFNGVNREILSGLNGITCPVALLNLGYMSNEKDLAVIRTEAGRNEICRQILKAAVQYKTYTESNH